MATVGYRYVNNTNFRLGGFRLIINLTPALWLALSGINKGLSEETLQEDPDGATLAGSPQWATWNSPSAEYCLSNDQSQVLQSWVGGRAKFNYAVKCYVERSTTKQCLPKRWERILRSNFQNANQGVRKLLQKHQNLRYRMYSKTWDPMSFSVNVLQNQCPSPWCTLNQVNVLQSQCPSPWCTLNQSSLRVKFSTTRNQGSNESAST